MTRRDAKGRLTKADPVYPGDPALAALEHKIADWALIVLLVIVVGAIVGIGFLVGHHAR